MSKLLTLILMLLLATSCFDDKKNKGKETKMADTSTLETDDDGLTKKSATLKTVHGNITIKFYPKQAPNTVTRIMELIGEGFYNGIVFHRVVPGFVVQGGDPTGTGTSGSGKNLKAEFNSLKHLKGSVAMARAQDPDSADSQFYIALNSIPHLDGQYTIFGMVVEGIEILEKIQQGDKMISFTLSE